MSHINDSVESVPGGCFANFALLVPCFRSAILTQKHAHKLCTCALKFSTQVGTSTRCAQFCVTVANGLQAAVGMWRSR